MALPWFHLSEIPDPGASAPLSADEARHASGARRRNAGEEVIVFDGRGGVARAQIAATERGRTEVRILERNQLGAPTPALELIAALPRGDRQSTMLGMATQIGLSRFVPLHCRRSVASAGPRSGERWQRIARESCKQSRQPHLPSFARAVSPEALCAEGGLGSEPAYLLHPEPGGGDEGLLLEQALRDRSTSPGRLRLIVGPEGGFADEEVDALVGAGARPALLAGGILRIEAAAVVGLGLLAQCFRTGPASARWA